MIVDAHVALDRERYPVERALPVLHQSKVQSAVIFAHAHAARIDSLNAYILEVAREHGLFPFYYLGGNPFTDTRPDTLEIPSELSQYAGIRWHRWIGEDVDREGTIDQDELQWATNLMESAEFEAFASAAAYYDLPVLFEESLAVTLEFVLRYPSLDVIIPHLGAQSGGQINVIQALWDAPNVYFETSLAQIEETTISRVGTDRIFFGSGYPEGDPETELDKIDRLPIPEDAKEGMYGDNLLSLLSAYSGK